MSAEAAKIITCILWLLLCLRFYMMIARRNIWQRRLIAVCAGAGAGLIYLAGTLLFSALRSPRAPEAPGLQQAQDVRIKMK